MSETTLPPQSQTRQPGIEAEMDPRPNYEPFFPGVGKLKEKVALVTGGDSGIGRAVCVAFAREGADVAFVYLDEHEDAEETRRLIEAEGVRALPLAGDIADPAFCQRLVDDTREKFGTLDVLVNNAAEQHMETDFADITPDQVERTFGTNVFGFFNITRAAMPHLKKGSVIINTTSITAFKGNPVLIDYSSTKGAIVAFTRALSQSLAEKGIRVNAVAPGPIWTPLIPASFPPDKVAKFGADVPLGRPGQPNEVAAAYLFLASPESAYITGQIIHVNGGTPI